MVSKDDTIFRNVDYCAIFTHQKEIFLYSIAVFRAEYCCGIAVVWQG